MTLPSQSAGRTPGKWVPLEPTPEMLNSGAKFSYTLRDAYVDMLAAAPEFPDLLAENSKLKGQLEEAVGALKQIAGPTFKGCKFESNATVTGFQIGVQVESPQEIAREALSKLKEAGS